MKIINLLLLSTLHLGYSQSDTMEVAIREVMNEFTDAFKQKDLASILEIMDYTEGATMLLGTRLLKGTEIKEYYQQTIDGLKKVDGINIDDINITQIDAHSALFHCSFEESLTLKDNRSLHYEGAITFLLTSLFIVGNVESQAKDEAIIKSEVEQAMHDFYDKMRNVDLTWMEYLSEDATVVHNGKFHNHDEFIALEKSFFKSLERLEINIIGEPITYILDSRAAAITIRHSIDTWFKNGEAHKGINQTLTFIWEKRSEKWYIVHSHFVTSGATNY
ncbi:MAG: hypothetical protein Tsb0034_27610 [Ekhidna sp.]